MNEEETTALLATLQNQVRQLQDVVAGGPEGVQAQWDDQGNYAKALSELKAEVETVRAALNTLLPGANL